ncbi:unnamed protein product, partial [marine sediment metagenome]
TLIDHFTTTRQVDDLNLNEIIEKHLRAVLENIYGDPVSQVSHVWQNFYTFQPGTICGILSFLEENRAVLEQFVDVSTINRVYQFVKSNGKSEDLIYELPLTVDTRTIHGDLNSRNILLRPATSKPILI